MYSRLTRGTPKAPLGYKHPRPQPLDFGAQLILVLPSPRWLSRERFVAKTLRRSTAAGAMVYATQLTKKLSSDKNAKAMLASFEKVGKYLLVYINVEREVYCLLY
jgi:hypothetical protein